MDSALTWLFGGSIAANVAVGLLIVVFVTIVGMYLVGFLQGRPLSFWPPKIGPREPKTNNLAPRQKYSDTSAVPQNLRLSSPLDAPPPTSNSSPFAGEFVYPEAKSEPDVTVPDLAVDLQGLFCDSIISQTAHSIIEKCTIQGVHYVLKRNSKELYDVKAITTLMSTMSHPVSGSIDFVTIATPLALWIDEYIWELFPFYDGVTLDKVVVSNRYHFSGALLAMIYEQLIQTLSLLHDQNILHRDVCPSNLMFSSRGKIILLDPSFASYTNTQPVPVSSSCFTAPEQLKGRAISQSDLFSVAATIVFLGTGQVPHTEDRDALHKQIGELDFGPVSPRFLKNMSTLFLSLLSVDLSNRPAKPSMTSLHRGTYPHEDYYDVSGILDVSPFGYLVMQDNSFKRCATQSEAKTYLKRAIDYGAVEKPNVRKDVERFLAGDNPWVR
jgi:serine/threonine protein kinase